MGANESITSTATSKIVADPIFFERIKASADGLKLGIYLDIPTLSAMINAQGTQNHVTKLQSYTIKINVKPPPENERINALADIIAAVGPGISKFIPSYILTNTGTTLINIKIVTKTAVENKTPG